MHCDMNIEGIKQIQINIDDSTNKLILQYYKDRKILFQFPKRVSKMVIRDKKNCRTKQKYSNKAMGKAHI